MSREARGVRREEKPQESGPRERKRRPAAYVLTLSTQHSAFITHQISRGGRGDLNCARPPSTF